MTAALDITSPNVPIHIRALKAHRLERITLNGHKVEKVEHLIPKLSQLVRGVRQGPDGWLYLLTDARNEQWLCFLAKPYTYRAAHMHWHQVSVSGEMTALTSTCQRRW